MLGLRRKNWQWSAAGKHPTASDYIRVGRPTPTLKNLFGWVQMGYKQMVRQKRDALQRRSWRFWIQVGENMLACGLLRDSIDSVGRPYPLLIGGEGPFPDWRRQWWKLPEEFQRIWERMEALANRRFSSLRLLEKEVQRLGNPTPPSDFSKSARPERFNGSRDAVDGPIPERVRSNSVSADSQTQILFFRLVPYERVDWFGLAQAYTAHAPDPHTVPLAFFVGGTAQNSFAALTSRPLNRNDFVWLWSI